MLRVRGAEAPWTAKEIKEIRLELESERARALADLRIAEADLQGLLREAGEGAGDDQADAGASIGGRDYEMTLAAGTRDKLDQIEHALERVADGSYGICESCDNPIGKLRLQAAPRATLCVDCKTKQESR
ncbi:MAG: TraR/DksA family transcriptional regulator [Lapillicoccus sp.]